MTVDKHGRALSVGDVIAFTPAWGEMPRFGVIYDLLDGSDVSNVWAVSVRPLRVENAPSFATALVLPGTFTGTGNVAVVEDGGVLTAADVELVARMNGLPLEPLAPIPATV